MLADLEKMGPADPEFDTMLATFESAVLAHAESEEDEEFPLLYEVHDEEIVQRMTAQLQIAEGMAPTHPHPHGADGARGQHARWSIRVDRRPRPRRPSLTLDHAPRSLRSAGRGTECAPIARPRAGVRPRRVVAEVPAGLRSCVIEGSMTRADQGKRNFGNPSLMSTGSPTCTTGSSAGRASPAAARRFSSRCPTAAERSVQG